MKGITLVELLATLAISAVLAGLLVPPMTRMYQRSQSTTAINWIVGAVNFTRHTAITRGVTTTLCPFQNRSACQGEWHNGIVIFADYNQDARINGQDYIITTLNRQLAGTLIWRSFGNRKYLQMNSLGFTRYQNGNFTFCPDNGNLRFARQIVVNLQGRVRLVHTRNAEGKYIDRHGKPLRCG